MTTNTSLQGYNRSHQDQCHIAATRQQKACPSDPFTYHRVFSHLLNGMCLISDYDVKFRKEARTTVQGATYSVEVPHNMKVM